MTSLKLFRSALFVSTALLLYGSALSAAEVFISKVPDSSGKYCRAEIQRQRDDYRRQFSRPAD